MSKLGPIYSLEAETQVLGAMIAYPDVVIPSLSGVLTEKDFFHPNYPAIFGAIKAMHSAGIGIDIISIHSRLYEIGEAQACGSPGSLAGFVSQLVTHLNVATHIATVKRYARCREIVEASRAIAIKATKVDLTGVEENLTALLESIKEEAKTETLIPVKVASERILAQIREKRDNPHLNFYIKSGFSHLDSVIGGFRPRELTVLAARPSNGKTALALNIAADMCRRKKKVGFLSIEMTAEDLLQRQYASEAGIALNRFEEVMTDEEISRLESARQTVDKWDLHIDEASHQTIHSSHKIIEKMVKSFGIEIVFIDYFQLISDESSRFEVERLNKASISLKRCCKELGIPIVLLAQLNRDVCKDGRKPRADDLKGSGQLEQDADRILALHWLGRKPGTEGVYQTQILVLKQRKGMRDVEIDMDYEGKHLRFEETIPDFCVRPKN